MMLNSPSVLCDRVVQRAAESQDERDPEVDQHAQRAQHHLSPANVKPCARMHSASRVNPLPLKAVYLNPPSVRTYSSWAE